MNAFHTFHECITSEILVCLSIARIHNLRRGSITTDSEHLVPLTIMAHYWIHNGQGRTEHLPKILGLSMKAEKASHVVSNILFYTRETNPSHFH